MLVPAAPTVAVDGEIVLIDGTGFPAALIVSETPNELPPPGPGFTTATTAAPADATSTAVIAAVNCVELTNVVVRFAPFHWTFAPLANPVPLTVNVNADAPATTLAGEIVLIAGVGLLTVNDAAAEVP